MSLERKIMKQLEGQTKDFKCPKCKKETKVIVGADAICECDNCGVKGKLDLTEVIKQFKKLGVR